MLNASIGFPPITQEGRLFPVPGRLALVMPPCRKSGGNPKGHSSVKASVVPCHVPVHRRSLLHSGCETVVGEDAHRVCRIGWLRGTRKKTDAQWCYAPDQATDLGGVRTGGSEFASFAYDSLSGDRNHPTMSQQTALLLPAS